MFDKELIAELYPGAEDLMVEPMLIHASTDDQLRAACNSGEYFGQLKKDGALYMFVKGKEGQCYLFGRTVSKKTGLLTEKIDNVPHIKEALSDLPNNTIILGEIYYPGGSSRNVTEIMGCLSDKAIVRQKEKGLIHYYIYDILQYDGVDFVKAQTDNWTRYKVLKSIYVQHKLYNFDNFIDLAEAWDDHLYARVGEALAAGEEGMVIKRRDGIYEPGKRPLSNLKAKRVDFIDAVIMGFDTPTKEYYGKDLHNWQYWEDNSGQKLPPDFYQKTGRTDITPVTKAWYNGWMNSRIIVGAYDKQDTLVSIGTIASGISDEMKEDMTLNPKNYLNKVARIQCMEKDNVNHTLRHGFYLGLHEDKNPTDCSLESIF